MGSSVCCGWGRSRAGTPQRPRQGWGEGGGGKHSETVMSGMAATAFRSSSICSATLTLANSHSLPSPGGAQKPTWRHRSHFPGDFICASDLDCFHMLMHIINIKSYLLQRTYICTSLPIYIITPFTHILEWVIMEKGFGEVKSPFSLPCPDPFARDACIPGHGGPSQLVVRRTQKFRHVSKC